MSITTWYQIIGGRDDGRLVALLRWEGDVAITNFKTADRRHTTKFARIPRVELEDPSKFKKLTSTP